MFLNDLSELAQGWHLLSLDEQRIKYESITGRYITLRDETDTLRGIFRRDCIWDRSFLRIYRSCDLDHEITLDVKELSMVQDISVKIGVVSAWVRRNDINSIRRHYLRVVEIWLDILWYAQETYNLSEDNLEKQIIRLSAYGETDDPEALIALALISI